MKKTVFSFILILAFMAVKAQDVPQTKPVVKSVIYVPQALPPSNPTIGEKYLSANGNYYRWDGSAWIIDVVGGTNDASELTTGVLPDARVQESNVTQHQESLSITESQISDLNHTVDTKLSNSEVEAAYNAQVPVVTQGIAETGSSTSIYRWTPQMINHAIQALAPASGSTQNLSQVLIEGADAGGTAITNLGEPSNGTDAATVNYVNASEIDTDGINKTADFTLSDMDIQAGVLNIQTNDSIVVTINSGLTETGFVKMIVEGTGFVAVEQGTITTLNGDYKSQSGEGETLGLRIKSNTEAVVLDPSVLLAYTPVAGETLGPELWTTESAGNGNTNADSTAGFQVLGTSGTMASVSDGGAGFIIQGTAGDGNDDYIRFFNNATTNALVNGSTYRFEIRARYVTLNAGTAKIDNWQGVVTSPDITLTNTLAPYTVDVTLNAPGTTFDGRFYMSRGFTGAGAVDNVIEVIIDSVKEVL
jgi:hypothetical protein